MNDNLLIFYAFKWQRQRQTLCASFIQRNYSHIQNWDNTELVLTKDYYIIDSTHFIDVIILLIDILYLEIKIMYTKMSVHYDTQEVQKCCIFIQTVIQFLKYFVFCNIFKYIHKRTEKNVLKHQSNPTWECMLCVKYVVTLGCCW